MKKRNEMLDELLEKLNSANYIKSDEIPNIDLYMDQVTTFMENHLKSNKRYEEDKILTKTMINNYAKNHLLPAPEKKKYTKDHMFLLIFIYYFKNILSLSDIETIFAPINERFFNSNNASGTIDMEAIYKEVSGLKESGLDKLKNELTDYFQTAENSFSNAPKKEADYLKTFSLICELTFDVYFKKQIIEQLIDYCNEDSDLSKDKKSSIRKEKKEKK